MRVIEGIELVLLGHKNKIKMGYTRHGVRDFIWRYPPYVFYRLWNTIIAVIDEDRAWVALWHGGWMTNLTKSRINAVLWTLNKKYDSPVTFHLFQENYKWWIAARNRLTKEIEEIPFQEGMVISYETGRILPLIAERPEVYFDICPNYQMHIGGMNLIIIEDQVIL